MIRRTFLASILGALAACLPWRRLSALGPIMATMTVGPELIVTPIFGDASPHIVGFVKAAFYRYSEQQCTDNAPIWWVEKGDLEWFRFAQLKGDPQAWCEMKVDGIKYGFLVRRA
jgi:hypothetical protein